MKRKKKIETNVIITTIIVRSMIPSYTQYNVFRDDILRLVYLY